MSDRKHDVDAVVIEREIDRKLDIYAAGYAAGDRMAEWAYRLAPLPTARLDMPLLLDPSDARDFAKGYCDGFRNVKRSSTQYRRAIIASRTQRVRVKKPRF